MATAVDLPPSGSGIPGITVSGTPSTGQVLTATSSSAADWETPSGGTPDADASTKGKIQLTNCLGGTAALPTVVNLAIPSEAQGDVLYRGASAWVRLGAGTSGQFLKTQGAAANLLWASIPDSDASTKGIVQLAGDFNGTGTAAATPRIGTLTGVSGVITGPSTAISIGATVASSGALRLGNAMSILARNFGDTANLRIATTDASDVITYGGTVNSGLVFGTSTGGNLSFQVNSIEKVKLDTNGLTVAGMTTGRVVVTSTGGLLTDLSGGITDAYVASAAAIAGTKISPSFGSQNLVSTGTLSLGTTPAASTGFIRLPGSASGNVVLIAHRNNANSADLELIMVDTANDIFFGNSSASGAYLRGVSASLYTASGVRVQANNTIVDFNVPIDFGKAVASPSIVHTAQTTDVATTGLTITSQGPWASATSTNRNPGNLTFTVPAAASGGAEGKIQFSVAGAVQGSFVSGGLEVGTSPATAGEIRVAKGGSIQWLNNAGGANLVILKVNASDQTELGGASAGPLLIGNATYGTNAWTYSTNGIAVIQNGSGSIAQLGQLTRSADAATSDFTAYAQSAFGTASTNKSGGSFVVRGGARKDSTGKRGGVRLALNQSTTENMVEACDVQAEATKPSRVLSLLRPAAITTTEMPSDTGDLVLYLGNAAVVPSANPVSGGIIYMDAGALKFRGSSGTVTTLGAA